MKATTITTEFSFSHSYSREFGYIIDATHPERTVKVYSVLINGERESVKIEHYMPANNYWVFSKSESVDKWLSAKECESMEAAKQYIKTSYNNTNNI